MVSLALCQYIQVTGKAGRAAGQDTQVGGAGTGQRSHGTDRRVEHRVKGNMTNSFEETDALS